MMPTLPMATPPPLFPKLRVEDAVLQQVVAGPIHVRPHTQQAHASLGNDTDTDSGVRVQPSAGGVVTRAEEALLAIGVRVAARARERIDLSPLERVEVVTAVPGDVRTVHVQQLARGIGEVGQRRPPAIPRLDGDGEFAGDRSALARPRRAGARGFRARRGPRGVEAASRFASDAFRSACGPCVASRE